MSSVNFTLGNAKITRTSAPISILSDCVQNQEVPVTIDMDGSPLTGLGLMESFNFCLYTGKTKNGDFVNMGLFMALAQSSGLRFKIKRKENKVIFVENLSKTWSTQIDLTLKNKTQNESCDHGLFAHMNYFTEIATKEEIKTFCRNKDDSDWFFFQSKNLNGVVNIGRLKKYIAN